MEEKTLKSNGTWIQAPNRDFNNPQFVVCLRNDGYRVSLERHKIYQMLPDPEAARQNELRVIDESGEDYLFPADMFAAIELPQALEQELLLAA